MVALAIAISFGFGCFSLAQGFTKPTSFYLLAPQSSSPDFKANHRAIIPSRRNHLSGAGVVLNSAPDGFHWFVKTEQFRKPFPEVKPHLEAHRAWVRSLREDQGNETIQTIVSGYRVDENDRPGGGGLMIFAAKDYAAAYEFVRGDPLVANECVDWQLNKWIAETGDIIIE
jgi:uncharacterized protein YciI